MVVKELDRFDIMLQAFQYEHSEWINHQRVVRFDEFFDHAQHHIRCNRRLKIMVSKVITERDNFWSNVIKPAIEKQQIKK